MEERWVSRGIREQLIIRRERVSNKNSFSGFENYFLNSGVASGYTSSTQATIDLVLYGRKDEIEKQQ